MADKQHSSQKKSGLKGWRLKRSSGKHSEEKGAVGGKIAAEKGVTSELSKASADRGVNSQPSADRGVNSHPSADKGTKSKSSSEKSVKSKRSSDKGVNAKPSADKGVKSKSSIDKGVTSKPTDSPMNTKPFGDKSVHTKSSGNKGGNSKSYSDNSVDAKSPTEKSVNSKSAKGSRTSHIHEDRSVKSVSSSNSTPSSGQRTNSKSSNGNGVKATQFMYKSDTRSGTTTVTIQNRKLTTASLDAAVAAHHHYHPEGEYVTLDTDVQCPHCQEPISASLKKRKKRLILKRSASSEDIVLAKQDLHASKVGYMTLDGQARTKPAEAPGRIRSQDSGSSRQDTLGAPASTNGEVEETSFQFTVPSDSQQEAILNIIAGARYLASGQVSDRIVTQHSKSDHHLEIDVNKALHDETFTEEFKGGIRELLMVPRIRTKAKLPEFGDIKWKTDPFPHKKKRRRTSDKVVSETSDYESLQDSRSYTEGLSPTHQHPVEESSYHSETIQSISTTTSSSETQDTSRSSPGDQDEQLSETSVSVPGYGTGFDEETEIEVSSMEKEYKLHQMHRSVSSPQNRRSKSSRSAHKGSSELSNGSLNKEVAYYWRYRGQYKGTEADRSNSPDSLVEKILDELDDSEVYDGNVTLNRIFSVRRDQDLIQPSVKKPRRHKVKGYRSYTEAPIKRSRGESSESIHEVIEEVVEDNTVSEVRQGSRSEPNMHGVDQVTPECQKVEEFVKLIVEEISLQSNESPLMTSDTSADKTSSSFIPTSIEEDESEIKETVIIDDDDVFLHSYSNNLPSGTSSNDISLDEALQFVSGDENMSLDTSLDEMVVDSNTSISLEELLQTEETLVKEQVSKHLVPEQEDIRAADTETEEIIAVSQVVPGSVEVPHIEDRPLTLESRPPLLGPRKTKNELSPEDVFESIVEQMSGMEDTGTDWTSDFDSEGREEEGPNIEQVFKVVTTTNVTQKVESQVTSTEFSGYQLGGSDKSRSSSCEAMPDDTARSISSVEPSRIRGSASETSFEGSLDDVLSDSSCSAENITDTWQEKGINPFEEFIANTADLTENIMTNYGVTAPPAEQEAEVKKAESESECESEADKRPLAPLVLSLSTDSTDSSQKGIYEQVYKDNGTYYITETVNLNIAKNHPMSPHSPPAKPRPRASYREETITVTLPGQGYFEYDYQNYSSGDLQSGDSAQVQNVNSVEQVQSDVINGNVRDTDLIQFSTSNAESEDDGSGDEDEPSRPDFVAMTTPVQEEARAQYKKLLIQDTSAFKRTTVLGSEQSLESRSTPVTDRESITTDRESIADQIRKMDIDLDMELDANQPLCSEGSGGSLGSLLDDTSSGGYSGSESDVESDGPDIEDIRDDILRHCVIEDKDEVDEGVKVSERSEDEVSQEEVMQHAYEAAQYMTQLLQEQHMLQCKMRNGRTPSTDNVRPENTDISGEESNKVNNKDRKQQIQDNNNDFKDETNKVMVLSAKPIEVEPVSKQLQIDTNIRTSVRDVMPSVSQVEDIVISEEIITQEIVFTISVPRPLSQSKAVVAKGDKPPVRDLHLHRVTRFTEADVELLEGPTLEALEEASKGSEMSDEVLSIPSPSYIEKVPLKESLKQHAQDKRMPVVVEVRDRSSASASPFVMSPRSPLSPCMSPGAQSPQGVMSPDRAQSPLSSPGGAPSPLSSPIGAQSPLSSPGGAQSPPHSPPYAYSSDHINVHDGLGATSPTPSVDYEHTEQSDTVERTAGATSPVNVHREEKLKIVHVSEAPRSFMQSIKAMVDKMSFTFTAGLGKQASKGLKVTCEAHETSQRFPDHDNIQSRSTQISKTVIDSDTHVTNLPALEEPPQSFPTSTHTDSISNTPSKGDKTLGPGDPDEEQLGCSREREPPGDHNVSGSGETSPLNSVKGPRDKLNGEGRECTSVGLGIECEGTDWVDARAGNEIVRSVVSRSTGKGGPWSYVMHGQPCTQLDAKHNLSLATVLNNNKTLSPAEYTSPDVPLCACPALGDSRADSEFTVVESSSGGAGPGLEQASCSSECVFSGGDDLHSYYNAAIVNTQEIPSADQLTHSDQTNSTSHRTQGLSEGSVSQQDAATADWGVYLGSGLSCDKTSLCENKLLHTGSATQAADVSVCEIDPGLIDRLIVTEVGRLSGSECEVTDTRPATHTYTQPAECTASAHANTSSPGGVITRCVHHHHCLGACQPARIATGSPYLHTPPRDTAAYHWQKLPARAYGVDEQFVGARNSRQCSPPSGNTYASATERLTAELDILIANIVDTLLSFTTARPQRQQVGLREVRPHPHQACLREARSLVDFRDAETGEYRATSVSGRLSTSLEQVACEPQTQEYWARLLEHQRHATSGDEEGYHTDSEYSPSDDDDEDDEPEVAPLPRPVQLLGSHLPNNQAVLENSINEALSLIIEARRAQGYTNVTLQDIHPEETEYIIETANRAAYRLHSQSDTGFRHNTYHQPHSLCRLSAHRLNNMAGNDENKSSSDDTEVIQEDEYEDEVNSVLEDLKVIYPTNCGTSSGTKEGRNSTHMESIRYSSLPPRILESDLRSSRSSSDSYLPGSQTSYRRTYTTSSGSPGIGYRTMSSHMPLDSGYRSSYSRSYHRPLIQMQNITCFGINVQIPRPSHYVGPPTETTDDGTDFKTLVSSKTLRPAGKKEESVHTKIVREVEKSRTESKAAVPKKRSSGKKKSRMPKMRDIILQEVNYLDPDSSLTEVTLTEAPEEQVLSHMETRRTALECDIRQKLQQLLNLVDEVSKRHLAIKSDTTTGGQSDQEKAMVRYYIDHMTKRLIAAVTNSVKRKVHRHYSKPGKVSSPTGSKDTVSEDTLEQITQHVVDMALRSLDKAMDNVIERSKYLEEKGLDVPTLKEVLFYDEASKSSKKKTAAPAVCLEQFLMGDVAQNNKTKTGKSEKKSSSVVHGSMESSVGATTSDTNSIKPDVQDSMLQSMLYGKPKRKKTMTKVTNGADVVLSTMGDQGSKTRKAKTQKEDKSLTLESMLFGGATASQDG